MLRSIVTVAALMTVLSAAPVFAQTTPAGIVTAVHGTANVARAATSETSPLRFKDDVFQFDRITTGERSLARILLGGKAVVTARERSIVTITAVPGAATLDLETGRVLLSVAKGTMQPGESIDIKTRNAIIGIRGTVVVAEFVPGPARDGIADSTVFTILTGTVEVTQLDPLAARAVGAPLRLGALQSVTVRGMRPPEVKTISAEQAKRITQGFTVPIRLTPESSKDVANLHASQVERELSSLFAPAPVGTSETETSHGSHAVTDKRAVTTGSTNSGTSQAPASGPVGSATGGAGSMSAVAAPVGGGSGAAAPVTGLVPGLAGPVTGVVSGVTGALTGTTVTPPPAATQPTTTTSTPRTTSTGGLLGGALKKTTGSLVK